MIHLIGPKNYTMAISNQLKERSGGLCELCNAENAEHEYTVTPKKDDNIENQVALCTTCLEAIDNPESNFHWRCLEGSIWNPNASVQALSYRILHQYKDEDWASGLIGSTDFDEDTLAWAVSAFEVSAVHKDAFGNVLENGDNVVLTQALNVKGTSFTANKGTVVKRIKLVSDNTDQIEGKINEQVIVILSKFVKKN